MKKLLLVVYALLLSSFNLFGQEIAFEHSGGTETDTYHDVIKFYRQVASESPLVSLDSIGSTDAGYPLHLVSISSGGDKLKLLINNGIHPGEPDGIDASMLLTKEIIAEKTNILDDFDIYIIPIYNIGGALNRNSTTRVNQEGPKAYGFRGNARNYDLNRDFTKADTRNTRSFYQIFHQVRPDLFIDTHVSNGADYQHNITHLFTQPDKLNSRAGRFLYEKFIPSIEQEMIAKDDPLTPYVNVFNRTPDAGFSQFMDWPRYSTGYTALFNTLGMMIETHMLKPYKIRVESTRNFIYSVIDVALQNEAQIKALRDDTSWFPEGRYPLGWRLDEEKPDTIIFKGYEGQYVESKLTGKARLFYDRNKPFTKDVLYFNHFKPGSFVEVPEAYVIPQGWHEIIDLLILNKAAYTVLPRDTSLIVETYRIKGFKTSERPYEGHYPHSEVEVEKNITEVKYRKGDYIFPVNQRAGRYLMEVLEPQGQDSFFKWNFFDTILQRKEGFSPYVFEDIAEELLKEDPLLKADFESWKASREDFRENWFAQLQFIYEKSHYAEEAFRKYPIGRIMP